MAVGRPGLLCELAVAVAVGRHGLLCELGKCED